MLDQPVQVFTEAQRFKTSAVRRGRGSETWRLGLIVAVTLLISAVCYPLIPKVFFSSADVLLRPTDQNGRPNSDKSVRDALDDNDVQTKMDMLYSRPLQAVVISQNHLLDDPEFNPTLKPSLFRREMTRWPWLASLLPPQSVNSEAVVEASLLKNLVVTRERKSYLIQVGYRAKDPEKSANLTNSLIAAFLDGQAERKRKLHRTLVDGLFRRVQELTQRYVEVEGAEHDYLERAGLMHRAENESTQRQLAALSGEVALAHARTIQTDNRAHLLLAMKQGGGLDSTSEALASPLLQRMRERLIGLSTGAGVGAGSVPAGASGQVLGELKQAIESETQRVLTAAQNDATTARQNELALHMELQRLDEKLLKWQAAEREDEALHREVVAAQAALTNVLTEYHTEQGRGAILQPDAEIVSYGVAPFKASFPDPLLYFGGAVTLAMLLCVTVLVFPRTGRGR